MPGRRTRFGPAQDIGEHRSLKIGSVSTTPPAKRSRKVAWFTKLTATVPGATALAGGAKGGSVTHSGHAARLPVSCQRTTCGRLLGGVAGPGLKKCLPSQ